MAEPANRSHIFFNLSILVIALAGISFQIWDFATTLEHRLLQMENELQACKAQLKKLDLNLKGAQ